MGFTTLLKFESGEPDPVQTIFFFFVSLVSGDHLVIS